MTLIWGPKKEQSAAVEKIYYNSAIYKKEGSNMNPPRIVVPLLGYGLLWEHLKDLLYGADLLSVFDQILI